MLVRGKFLVAPSKAKQEAAGRLMMSAATAAYPPLGFLQEMVSAAPPRSRVMVLALAVVGWFIYRGLRPRPRRT